MIDADNGVANDVTVKTTLRCRAVVTVQTGDGSNRTVAVYEVNWQRNILLMI